jgi:hypothetical protein
MMETKQVFDASAFLDYVTRYAPNFPLSIEGASPKEIDQLQEVIGRTLPESYRQFLYLMGKGSAWINLGRDHNTAGTTDIREVTRAYQKYINTRSHRIPSNCIAISVLGPDFDVCLDLGIASDEPRVVISEGFTVYEEYAETLNQLLFRTAFVHYQPSRWMYHARFRSTVNGQVKQQALSLAASTGFSELWFSDRNAFCGERPTASICLRKYEHDALVATIAGQTADEVSGLGQVFSEKLKLRRLR